MKTKTKTKTSILTLTNIFFILVAMCFFSSCDRRTKDDLGSETQLIDGCEYIVSRNVYGDIVSHKGNCNNPFHNKVIHDTIYVIKVK